MSARKLYQVRFADMSAACHYRGEMAGRHKRADCQMYGGTQCRADRCPIVRAGSKAAGGEGGKAKVRCWEWARGDALSWFVAILCEDGNAWRFDKIHERVKLSMYRTTDATFWREFPARELRARVLALGGDPDAGREVAR